MSYRAYEDRNNLIKHFVNRDLEFEIITTGLESLKGSSKWGKKAQQLEQRFLAAFDGLTAPKVAPSTNDTGIVFDSANLYESFMHAVNSGVSDLKPCDVLSFRRAHDDCIRFFREIRDAYNVLTIDDQRDLKK